MGQFWKTTFSESIDVKRMILVGVVKEPERYEMEFPEGAQRGDWTGEDRT